MNARAGRRVLAWIVAVPVAVAVAAAVLPKGLPPGIVLQGLVVGGLTSFTAMGLVLVYRSARIVNFAQYAMGALAAAFAVLAVASWGLDWYAAVCIGLVVAAVCGFVVDRIVIWRLQRAPRLIVTVATIGVLQILAFFQGEVPNLGGPARLGADVFHGPLTASFSVGTLLFTGDHLIAMAAVPVVLAGLWWFLERTDLGTAVRAAADAPERAVLLGVPVRRVSAVVWTVAAVLSGVGVILSAPITHSSFLGAASGPEDLLPALAAAVLAGFESFPAAVGWALAIGVLQQAVLYSYAQSSTADIVLFVFVLVGLLVQRGRRSDISGWGEHVQVRAVRPVPAPIARLPEVRAAKLAGIVLVAAAAVFVPLRLSQADLGLLALIAVFGIVAVSLVVLTGWAGQISLGQFAFVGIGAIVTGVLTVHAGVDLFVALLASAVAGGVIACAIGLPALRLPGLVLAAVTLAFAVPVSTYLLSSAHMPYLNPTDVPRPVLFGRFPLTSAAAFYELCLALLVVVMLVAHNFRRSRAGRVVVAVRDNPRAAASYGVSPLRAGLVAFAFAGALAALAGGLYIVDVGSAGTSIDPQLSLTVFAMVVVGGLGSLFGALLGAVYVESVLYFLPSDWRLLASGAGLLILLLVLPEGLGGLVYSWRDKLLFALARRRGIQIDAVTEPQARRPVGSDEATSSILFGGNGARPPVFATDPGAGDGPEALWITVSSLSTSAVPVTGVGCAALALAGPSGVDGRPPAGHAVACLDDVDVCIGPAQILSRVRFGVAQGEIVALVGTNGAGKSTTLLTLAGVLCPTTKKGVVLDGCDATGTKPEERVALGVITMPGGRGVFPSLTVEENMRLAAWVARRRRGKGRDAQRSVDELFPRLGERRDVQAGMLSGGEQQMLALALALTCVPRVLMIDELSLGLAPMVVAELLGVVRRLSESGVAVIVVEQSVPVVASLAHRAVVMERGQIRFNGPPAELVAHDGILRSSLSTRAVPSDNGHAGLRSPVAPANEAASPVAPANEAASPVASADGAGFTAVAALRVRAVSKSFGGVAALSDVSFELAPGEVLGLIGSNGAGKTTILDVCSGFVTQDRGSVELFGRDIGRYPPSFRAQLGLGRTFQDARLFPSMTVAETIATACERCVPVRDPLLSIAWTRSVKDSEQEVYQRVDSLLVDMGLEPYRDLFVAALSTGVRRIVELACALAHGPQVLLLDEPASGVSHEEVDGLAEVLRTLRDRTGIAVLVIEHDVPLVAAVADRLVCLHLGEVIAEGSPAAVLSSGPVLSSFLGDLAHARAGATTSPVPPSGSPVPPVWEGGAPEVGADRRR